MHTPPSCSNPASVGRGFGLLGLVDGIGDLVSSIVVGVIFTVTSPVWGFIYAAVLATAGAAVMLAERTGVPHHPTLAG